MTKVQKKSNYSLRNLSAYNVYMFFDLTSGQRLRAHLIEEKVANFRIKKLRIFHVMEISAMYRVQPILMEIYWLYVFPLLSFKLKIEQ